MNVFEIIAFYLIGCVINLLIEKYSEGRVNRESYLFSLLSWINIITAIGIHIIMAWAKIIKKNAN